LLEGALFLGSDSVALFDACEGLSLDWNWSKEKACGGLRDSEPGKEIVIGLLESGQGVFCAGALAGGGYGGDFADSEGIRDALEGGQKHGVRSDVVQSSSRKVDFSIRAFHALKPRD
jgi:hypothetical protein